MSHLQPSGLWRTGQAIKGTHNKHLTVPDADLRGLWVVVTGGNSGIGYEAALQFAKWGANIVLACRPNCPSTEQHPDDAFRRVQGAARVAGCRDSRIELWHIDMADLSSVDAFAQRWLDTGRPLDRLINNAGMGGTTGRKIVTRDGFGIVHQVGLAVRCGRRSH